MSRIHVLYRVVRNLRYINNVIYKFKVVLINKSRVTKQFEATS